MKKNVTLGDLAPSSRTTDHLRNNANRSKFRLLMTAYLFSLFGGFADPFFTKLETSLGILMFLSVAAFNITHRQGRFKLPLGFLLALAFCIYLLINLLYNQADISTFPVENRQYIRLVSITISISIGYSFYWYVVTFRDLEYLLRVIYFCLFAVALISVMGSASLSFQTNESRLQSSLGSPNEFAFNFGIMSALLLLSFSRSLSSRSSGKVWMPAIYLMLAFGLVLNIYYTGSRQGMIFSAILILIATIMSFSSFLKGPGLPFVIIIAILLSVAISGLAGISLESNYYIMRLLNLFSYFNGQGLVVQENSLFERMHMFQTGIDLWWDRPLIGYGVDSFRYIGGFETYSHNNFVELLVSGGILGFSIYIIAYLVSIRQILRATAVPALIRSAGILVLLLLLGSGLGIVLYYSRFSWIAFGILVALPNLYQPIPFSKKG